ncbi:uncharacterized protein VTP21DRAFT_5080 [Calcarisporiella thermophila]|uniref:uncharacterized protein n=1 Tax=Calcarisporiella thermophila TaxID=911321 RepID=UPI00374395E1
MLTEKATADPKFGLNSEENTDEHEDENENIILAMIFRNHRLGCAYFDTSLSTLFVMEDIKEDPPFEFAKLFDASTILTNSHVDEKLLVVLKENVKLELRPMSEFAYPAARKKLLIAFERWKYPNPPRPDMKDVYLHLSSCINLEYHEAGQSVGCAGALIAYLSSSKLNPGEAKRLFKIDQFTAYVKVVGDCCIMFKLMTKADFWAAYTLLILLTFISSLQIFEDELHPSLYLHAGSKGVSLFGTLLAYPILFMFDDNNELSGMLNCTRTTLGSQMLKRWFLRPTSILDIIEQRHRGIECFLRLENAYNMQQVAAQLRLVKNIPRILDAMLRKSNLSDWKALVQFARACVNIRNQILYVTYANGINIFEKSAVACDISKDLPQTLANTLNVTYIPQIGYLISLPLPRGDADSSAIATAGFQYQFSTASTMYYKNSKMCELDAYLGDIYGYITDRELEIIQKLQNNVLRHTLFLQQAAEVCAELDCLIALAECAKKYNYTRPAVVNENVLHVTGGRHPLQEHFVDTFVPNDISLAERDKKVMLLTGCNSSGKSVYMKQVFSNRSNLIFQ